MNSSVNEADWQATNQASDRNFRRDQQEVAWGKKTPQPKRDKNLAELRAEVKKLTPISVVELRNAPTVKLEYDNTPPPDRHTVSHVNLSRRAHQPPADPKTIGGSAFRKLRDGYEFLCYAAVERVVGWWSHPSPAKQTKLPFGTFAYTRGALLAAATTGLLTGLARLAVNTTPPERVVDYLKNEIDSQMMESRILDFDCYMKSARWNEYKQFRFEEEFGQTPTANELQLYKVTLEGCELPDVNQPTFSAEELGESAKLSLRMMPGDAVPVRDREKEARLDKLVRACTETTFERRLVRTKVEKLDRPEIDVVAKLQREHPDTTPDIVAATTAEIQCRILGERELTHRTLHTIKQSLRGLAA